MGGVMTRKECVESMYGDIWEIEIFTVELWKASNFRKAIKWSHRMTTISLDILHSTSSLCTIGNTLLVLIFLFSHDTSKKKTRFKSSISNRKANVWKCQQSMNIEWMFGQAAYKNTGGQSVQNQCAFHVNEWEWWKLSSCYWLNRFHSKDNIFASIKEVTWPPVWPLGGASTGADSLGRFWWRNKSLLGFT